MNDKFGSAALKMNRQHDRDAHGGGACVSPSFGFATDAIPSIPSASVSVSRSSLSLGAFGRPPGPRSFSGGSYPRFAR
jgi:hypothetical protein